LWPVLVLMPMAALGQDQPEQDDPAPEFIDFLEYLGSWNGEEQDWVQFLDNGADLPQRDAAGAEPEHEDGNDVVS
jgi:hypothetical protein